MWCRSGCLNVTFVLALFIAGFAAGSVTTLVHVSRRLTVQQNAELSFYRDMNGKLEKAIRIQTDLDAELDSLWDRLSVCEELRRGEQ